MQVKYLGVSSNSGRGWAAAEQTVGVNKSTAYLNSFFTQNFQLVFLGSVL